MKSFLFGGNTGQTYESLQRQRKIADQLMAASTRTPRNVGEGLNAIGNALAVRTMNKRADAADMELRGKFDDNFQDIVDALSGGSGGGGYGGGSNTFVPAPEKADSATVGPQNVGATSPGPQDPSGDANQRLMLARTLQAEAGNQGFEGMLDVGSVILNRADSGNYGDGVDGVIMKPGQFSAWNGVTGYAGGEQGQNMSFQPSEEAMRAADTLLNGGHQDQTGGATHYYNPTISQPKWGNNSFVSRGDHVFGNSDAGSNSGANGQTGGIPNQAIMMQLAELSANPYASPGEKQIVDMLLGRMMDQGDPMQRAQLENARLRNEALRNPKPTTTPAQSNYNFAQQNGGYEGSFVDYQSLGNGAGGGVKASKILEDGTTIQSTGTGVRVFGPLGNELTGQPAADAIAAANKQNVTNQGSIYDARRRGTLEADIDVGGEAAASVDAGKQAIKIGGQAWESVGKLSNLSGVIREAVTALKGGADTGVIMKWAPNITEQSAALPNAMDRMGLSVIQATTFGALSKGELELAMQTAVPRDLSPPELLSWLEKKLVATDKSTQMMQDYALFMSDPNNTLHDWIEQIKRTAGDVPTPDATQHDFSTMTISDLGKINVDSLTDEQVLAMNARYGELQGE